MDVDFFPKRLYKRPDYRLTVLDFSLQHVTVTPLIASLQVPLGGSAIFFASYDFVHTSAEFRATYGDPVAQVVFG